MYMHVYTHTLSCKLLQTGETAFEASKVVVSVGHAFYAYSQLE